MRICLNESHAKNGRGPASVEMAVMQHPAFEIEGASHHSCNSSYRTLLDRQLDHEDLLLEILGSLVKVNRTSLCVELAHYSVIEFLTARAFASAQICNPYYLDLTSSHG
jgi:hypothetical protein